VCTQTQENGIGGKDHHDDNYNKKIIIIIVDVDEELDHVQPFQLLFLFFSAFSPWDLYTMGIKRCQVL